jgi:hypothetical protein
VNLESDSAQPDFWSERYASGSTPWQLDHVPARVETFIRTLPPQRRILVPGCGQDYRTIDAFVHSGHRVTGIDFSPIAAGLTTKALAGSAAAIVLGDFFSCDFNDEPFDVIYERTFLCSLPPQRWKDYAARIFQLLRPGGALAGFFFYGDESEPPPYALTEETANAVFGDRFELEISEPVTDSLSIFGGKEKWQEWRLRS